jgi:hypothetical protein
MNNCSSGAVADKQSALAYLIKGLPKRYVIYPQGFGENFVRRQLATVRNLSADNHFLKRAPDAFIQGHPGQIIIAAGNL